MEWKAVQGRRYGNSVQGVENEDAIGRGVV
jgi:hypothetical protein